MLLTSEQVAPRIGVSVDHFRRTYRQLIATRRFPHPVGASRRLKWLAEAVDGWMLAQSHPTAEGMEIADQPEDDAPPTDEERRRYAVREVERLGRGRAAPP